jgi:hypothetical protein
MDIGEEGARARDVPLLLVRAKLVEPDVVDAVAPNLHAAPDHRPELERIHV